MQGLRGQGRDNLSQAGAPATPYNRPSSQTTADKPMKSLRIALPLLVFANLAQASCGSSFCMVNTNWDVQGMSHDSGWQADLRYSYARADRWMAGSSGKTTEAPSGSGEEIENKRTISQTINLNLDYAFNRQWSIALGLPFVMRDHSHTLDASGGPVAQQGKFSEPGDIRVVGKYKFNFASHDSGAGLRFGLKLPTGATHQTMSPASPDEPATPYALERSSQPGTGSTDAILGAYYFRNAPGGGWGWFVNTQIQSALATKDDYRPGTEINLDLGMHVEVAQGVNLLLQLNGQHRARDGGANASAASGGHSINLSPGASYALTPQTQLYGFVQLPIVQYVNADPAEPASGQLAARWSATVGLTQRF